MVNTVNKKSKRGRRRKHDKYDEYAWFIVFLLALSYFITTRRTPGGSDKEDTSKSEVGGLLSSLSKPYDIISSSIIMMTNDAAKERRSEELIRSIFYISSGENNSGSSTTMSSSTASLLTLETHRRLEIILSSPLDIIQQEIEQQCIITKNNNTTDNSPSPYFSYLSSTTWVHDTNIGRGYLLLADAGRSGRIWRWEVGGGPVTIGRSLHMERSGCRSYSNNNSQITTMTCPENLFTGSSIGGGGSVLKTSSTYQQDVMVTTTSSFHPPLLGSASLAVEIQRNVERASAGMNLIVAEWGERRIVRVEGETGARTPLIITVPNHDVNSAVIMEEGKQQRRRRVFRPNHLTYTPFGDLLFSDTFANDNDESMNNGVVYRRKEAVHLAPIAVERSRDAHGWISTTGNEDGHEDDNAIDILFQTSGSIEGMTLGLDFSTLYVLVVKDHIGGWTKMLHKVPLGTDDEDEEDSEDNDDDDDGKKTKSNKQGITLLYEMTSSDCENDDANPRYVDYDSVGSKLSIDEKGVVYMVTCPSSVTLLSLSQDEAQMVGILSLDNNAIQIKQNRITPKLTSVGFGEDKYLYLTTANELMRVKTRVSGGLSSLPTNMVLPSPSTKK